MYDLQYNCLFVMNAAKNHGGKGREGDNSKSGRISLIPGHLSWMAVVACYAYFVLTPFEWIDADGKHSHR